MISVGNAHPVSETIGIAIVDDDHDMREALGGLVLSLGYTPLTFASAEAFLAFPRRSRFRCIIVDVCMAGLSGIELQSILNQEDDSPAIIFVTSHGDEGIREKALKGGARCFLGKPVDVQILIDCLETALEVPL
ncbi:MAG TPA: response regulator [Afipia sp.]